MANFFNISVSPEIAAAVVKIDAIKNDTGPIRNDVTAIHDTNLPAVKFDTGAIRNDVTAIHDTMLPSVKVDTGAIRNDVTDIHDTNLPALKIDTVAILNRSNAIKLKTDALPQNVRGEFKGATITTASASYVDVVNVTGKGKLLGTGAYCQDAGDTLTLLITIDGLVFQPISHTGDIINQSFIPEHTFLEGPYCKRIPTSLVTLNTMNIEFAISLRVQIKRSAGTANNIRCGCNYLLDNF